MPERRGEQGRGNGGQGRWEPWEEALRARLNATRAPESLRARIHAMLAVEFRLGR